MAGSYRHATTEDGRLSSNTNFVGMVENLGDAYETVEEMYGMIWWLADSLARHDLPTAAELVESARDLYKIGLGVSPGVEPEEYED